MSLRNVGALVVVAAVAAAVFPAQERPARIRVEVVDAAGAPVVAPLWVGLLALDGEGTGPVRGAEAHDGAALPWWDVPPGRYRVMCAAEGLGWFLEEPVELAPGARFEEVCRLPRMGWAEIVVVSAETGRPLEGAVVEPAFLRLPNADRWPRRARELLLTTARATTGPDGRARVGLSVGSRADLVVSAPGTALEVVPAVRFGDRVARPPVVRLPPGGELEVALDVLQPERYLDLELVPVRLGAGGDGDRAHDAGPTLERLLRRRPGADGHVRWSGLAPGAYAVVARWRRPGGGPPGSTHLGIAVVRPQGYELLELALGEVEVSGRIVGVPPESAAVLRVHGYLTGSTGSIEVVSEPGGTPQLSYRVRLSATRHDWVVLSSDLSVIGICDPWARRESPDPGCDLVVGPGGLEVRVVNRLAEPVPGAEVRASRTGAWSSLLHRARTDAEGRARLVGLEPGRWRVVTRHEELGIAGPAEVAVGASDAPLLLTLEPGVALEGVVTDPEGRGVPGARVLVGSRRVPSFWAEARTDDEGRFAVRHLPPGPAVVVADPPRRDRGLAVAEVELGSAGPVRLEVGEGVGGVVLTLPSRPPLEGDGTLEVEVDGIVVPVRLLARAATVKWPSGPGDPGFVRSGLPPGLYRLTYRDVSGEVVARTVPFRLGAEARGAVLDLELER